MFATLGTLAHCAPWLYAQATIQTSTPKSIQPSNIFTYPGDTSMEGIHVAPDGHVYVNWLLGSVNLWAVIVFYWPEITGVAISLILLLRLRRLIKRPMVVGQPHCRHCNYLLTHTESERCPECGAKITLRNRIIGRARWRRVLVCCVLLATTMAGYFWGRTSLPRQGTVSQWFLWLSPGLYDWAWHHKQAWLHDRKHWISQVVEIDPTTGAVIRVVFQEKHAFVTNMEISTDGRLLALWGYEELWLQDIQTGKQVAHWPLEGNLWLAKDQAWDGIQSVKLDSSGTTAYVALNGGSIQAWNLATGEARELFTCERGHYSDHLFFHDLQRPGCFGLQDWSTRHLWRLRIWDDRERRIVQTFEAPTVIAVAATVLSPDGQTAYVFDYGPPAVIHVRDMRDGMVLKSFDPGNARQLYPVSFDARFLFVQKGRPQLVLAAFDTQTSQHVADLITQNSQVIDVTFLSDNTTMVVITWQNGLNRIMTYDLSAIDVER